MKLLFLNHNVAWSGTFFRTFQLGQALVRRGHRVTLVTTSRDLRWAPRSRMREGVELIEMPDLLWGRARTGWDLWNTMHRAVGLRPSDYDAIHAFDCRPAVILPALALARRGGLPLFVDWADWWGRGGAITERPGFLVNRLIGGVETWFEESFRHHALGTTVISKALEQRAVGLGIAPGTIHRFPNGCDHEQIRPLDYRAARAELSVADDARIVAHVGVIYPRDLTLLLGAMARVVEVRPEARLVMLGNPKAPLRLDALPGGALHSTGFVDFDVLQHWLGASDCCVVPLSDTVCNWGRWPGKVNDYLCAGRAVVMPRVGDAAEWIDRERAGWTSRADVGSFADALMEALGTREGAAEAGARGRALAETRLSWATVAAGVDEFYDRALAGRWADGPTEGNASSVETYK